MRGSVDGISAWSMSSLRWAAGIQSLANGVMLQLFQKLTAPKFKGYVRRSERKARSHVRPPAWPRCSYRSRHQGGLARGPPGTARGRRQLSADARISRARQLKVDVGLEQYAADLAQA